MADVLHHTALSGTTRNNRRSGTDRRVHSPDDYLAKGMALSKKQAVAGMGHHALVKTAYLIELHLGYPDEFYLTHLPT